ncbi:MAG: NAD(P)H-hydrate dehydratase [Bacteroidales bacterium]|nr:NAD(P)H-hydrate dehydratase [Bacteroidales bacterium]
MNTITAESLRPCLRQRARDSHKGDYGHLLIVAGCQTMPGAAVLATGAALQSGCGLVTLHSTSRALQAVVNSFPSAMLSEMPGDHFSDKKNDIDKYNAIAVGPGLGQAPETVIAFTELLNAAKQAGVPMVLDADALNIIASYPELKALIPAGSVMTPHLGELRRLVSWDSEDALTEVVKELSTETGCAVVVKGHGTRIFAPDGSCFVNTTGNPGMAKGGSGDVLTGLVGGLMARGYSAVDAARLGVWVHGYAGDCLTAERTAEAYSSRDLIDWLWRGFAELY